MPSLEGTSLGRYRLLHRLGRGGMSEVYLAHDELMNRDVAVKVVSSTHTDYIERFQREAEAIGRLHHDHILPAYDFGEQPPWHYLVMPYIPYCTLQDVLEKGPLSLEYASELLQQIASGLQFAHDEGVIHRDIKPSNILLRDDHYIYLADFGLAKALDDREKVTQTGVLLGTPEYMAPELADGPATKSSDVYALGILLYQMVTGKLPFTGDTPLIVYLKQMREQPVQPSRVNPAIPHAIDVVIMRALEKDPRRRYESPLALAQAYRRALAEIEAQPLSPQYEMEHGATAFDVPRSPAPHRNDAPPPAFEPSASPAHQPVEPVIPVITPHQPDKLILPPLVPATPERMTARGPAPRGAPPVRPAPTYPRDPNRRRVPARRENRNSLLGLSLLIGLLFIILVGLVFYIAANHTQGNHTTNGQTTATVGSTASATSVPSPSATSNPSPTPDFAATVTAVTGQTPLLTDSLSSDNGSWSNDGQACAFQNGTYHVLVNQANFLQPCLNTKFNMNNGAIQVHLALLQGSDAGIIYSQSSDQFYDFEITGQGTFYFRRHDANGGGNYVFLISPTSAPSIVSGSANNTLLMLVNNGNFTFFINGVYVGSAKDSNYHTGQIGLVSGTLAPTSSADASFSNLAVYPLS